MISFTVAVQAGMHVLEKLIQFDTSAGAARETEAALWLKEEAKRWDLDGEVIEPVHGAGSFVLSLSGQKPESLLLLSHLDTAPSGDASDWSHHPLSGERTDTHIWGRGAVDCKGLVAAWFAVILLLKGAPRQRGIVFAATAGEETRSSWGAKWLLEHHPALQSCRWVLNEGGGWSQQIGLAEQTVCQIGEKGFLSLLLPTEKMSDHRNNLRLTASLPPLYRAWLRKQGMVSKLAAKGGNRIVAARFNQLQRTGDYALDTTEMHYHTVAVKPYDEKQVEVQIRVLPGSVNDQVLARLLAHYRIDPGRVIVLESMEPTLSAGSDKLFQAIERIHATPLIPYISPAPSDSYWFRQRSLPVYGWFPHVEPSEWLRIHQTNERISYDSFRKSVFSLYELVRYFLGSVGKF